MASTLTAFERTRSSEVVVPTRRVAEPTAPPQPRHASGFSVTHEAIAKLAYSKFMARGGVHGHHEDDWASAKRDLLIGAGGA